MTLTYDVGKVAVRVFGGVRPLAQVALAETPTYAADGAGYACELRMQPYRFAPLTAGEVVGNINGSYAEYLVWCFASGREFGNVIAGK